MQRSAPRRLLILIFSLLGLALILPASFAEEAPKLSATVFDAMTPGAEVRIAVSWKGELPQIATIWADLDDDGHWSKEEILAGSILLEEPMEVVLGLVPEWSTAKSGRARLRVTVGELDSANTSIELPMAQSCDWASGFNAEGAHSTVQAFVVFDDGSGPALYAGGRFSAIENTVASRIARWDGTGWSALGSGFNNAVRTLGVYGGEIVAGGDFTSAGGISASRIAKWDGSNWSALGAGLSGPPYALEVHSGYLVAAGSFSTAGGLSASRIARWNGSAWSSFGSGMNGTVWDLEVFGGDLIAGGQFSTAGGVAASNVASWIGSSWVPLGSGVNSTVRALEEYGVGLVAAGSFSMAGGGPASRIAVWSGVAWSSLGSGTNNIVTVLGTYGAELVASGAFTSAGGIAANRIARWNGVTWSALGTGLGNNSLALAEFGGKLVTGGDFMTAGGTAVNRLAEWNGTNWSALAGASAGNGMNSYVNDFVLFQGDLVVAGGFTSAGGTVANRVARWNGSAWSQFGTGMNADVWALAVYGGDLVAGGSFSIAGGAPASRIARWDGSSWSALGSGMNGSVYSLQVFGGDLVAGGDFGSAGGVGAAHIARWNGSNWFALGSGLNQRPAALAEFGGDLIAGGFFTIAGGAPANYVARWNGTNWAPLGTGLNHWVWALTEFQGDLVVAGQFGVAGGTLANNIALWDGGSWSAVGSGFNTAVHTVLVFGGELVAGGQFTLSGATPAIRIARWDGGSWNAMGSGVEGSFVWTLATYDQGVGPELWVGGNFGAAGGNASSHLAKWSCTCSESHTYPTGLWQLTGLACNPTGADTVSEVVGDDLGDADYLSRWVMWERDEGTDTYNQLTLGDSLSQGSGYWLKTLDGGTVDVDGNPTSTVCPATSTYSKCFDTALTGDGGGRWNMVSHAYPSSVSGTGIRIVDGGGAEYTLTAAEGAGLVEKTLHEWSGGSYQAFDGATPGMEGSLDAFDGFWVKAFADVTLRVPTPGEPIPFAGPERVQEDWMIRLIASSGELADRGNVFGVHSAAKVGLDDMDLEEREPFGEEWLSVIFTEVAKEAKSVWGYTSDFRPGNALGRQAAWRFAVRSSTGDREVTLRWEGPEKVLANAVLIDEATSTRIRPKPGNSYRFVLRPGETERSFRWANGRDMRADR